MHLRNLVLHQCCQVISELNNAEVRFSWGLMVQVWETDIFCTPPDLGVLADVEVIVYIGETHFFCFPVRFGCTFRSSAVLLAVLLVGCFYFFIEINMIN